MKIPFTVAFTIAAIIPSIWGQSTDPREALQQALNAQFKPTQLSQDKADIVTAGTVLVFQKDGLIMYAVASPGAPLNTYKNGKVSKSFGTDLAITMLAPGNNTSANYPQRKFVAGEKCWFGNGHLVKDGIVFRLYSDPYDDVRYFADLKFPFDKRSIPTAEGALAKIAEVVTIQPEEPSTDKKAATNEQAVPTGVLQNDDVVKMVKAGLDDSIVISKIKSSRCQFDTAPDTLIQLKQSGVSTAVLKAMTESGNSAPAQP